MPNLFLDPIAGRRRQADRSGGRHRRRSCWARNEGDWSAKDLPARQLNDREDESLFDLALDHLKTRLPAQAGRRAI